MSKYPRIHSHSPLEEKWLGKEECQCCSKLATHRVRISETYMRGEDDVYVVCQRHWKMAQENLDKFFGHYRTKDKFLNRVTAA